MGKRKNKSILFVFIILILLAIICYLCIGKQSVISNAINKSKELFAPNQTEADDGSITYNTAGDDSANYIDGDTSGQKSEWVKNGDTWTYTFYVDDPNAEWYVYEDSSTLMPGYTGDHTEYNADKLFTEEDLTSFTPNSDMETSTDDEGRTVYTWLDSENSYKVIDNGDGTYKKITTKLSLTITNYKMSENTTKRGAVINYGDLTINKIVKDSQGNVLNESEDSTNFTFTITLTADESQSALIEGTKVYGDIVFKDGVGTVALKAGNSITISGIPEGLTYAVKEKQVKGYDIACETKYYGTIVEGTPGVVTYVNTLKPDAIPGGQEVQPSQLTSFTLRKEVIGNAEQDEPYNFEIVLDNLQPDTEYSLSNGDTFKSDSVGSANLSISLKDRETVTIQNIPVGTKYKIYEHPGDYVSSYIIVDDNNAGLINNTAKNNTKMNRDLSTNTETADSEENVTVTFRSRRIVTQDLKVQKVVTDPEDTNSYIFEIDFANMEAGSSFNSSVGKVIAEDDGTANLQIYLAGGEEAEFYSIPVGTTYTVKELASSAIASYTITDANGTNQIVSDSKANNEAKKALSTELETVNQGEDVTVTFINDTVNQEPDSVSSSLGVTKNVVDKNGEKVENCDETFTFELSTDNESNPMPEKTSVTVKGNGTASFGTITFTETGTYTYTVVEKAGTNEDCQYDNSTYTITYEVTNLEGLLEITKIVKKNGFESDVVAFTNVVEVEEPVTPVDPEEPTEPENPEDPTKPDEDKKEEPANEDEEKVEPTEQATEAKEETKEEAIKPIGPQTGDKVMIVLSILVVAGIVMIITFKRRNNKK